MKKLKPSKSSPSWPHMDYTKNKNSGNVAEVFLCRHVAVKLGTTLIAALGYLIAHPGGKNGALAVAESIAQDSECDPEVRWWLLNDSHYRPDDILNQDFMPLCRWGFTLAFMCLRRAAR